MSEPVNNHIIKKEGPCFNCEKPCTEDDWCFGCKHFVCAVCGIHDHLGPGHSPSQHLESPEDE